MELDFDKMNGLVPAIIQDNETRKVLMLGFMNKEAYDKTVETGKVTFFSRTKNRLWTKGEESGNFLHVVSIKADCDNDTLLIQVEPVGPVCHTGTDTCWGEKNEEPVMFLKALQDFIDKRHEEMPEGSYTTSLFESGINKIAQKVGEEAVETVPTPVPQPGEPIPNPLPGPKKHVPREMDYAFEPDEQEMCFDIENLDEKDDFDLL